MLTLETGIRLIVIGMELLIAVILLFNRGLRVARISAAMLALSSAGYLVISDPELRNALSGVSPVIILLATIVPYCLWSFARAVFEAPWPPSWVIGAVALVIPVSWFMFVREDSLPPDWIARAGVFHRLVALVLVGHSLWMAWQGLQDDLVERRRTFRIWFVIIVALEVGAVVIAELLLGQADPPNWLALLNVLVIGVMTMGLAALVFQSRPDFIPLDDSAAPVRPPAGIGDLGPADSVLCDKLMEAMDASAYRETGLTISRLADKLEFPEHQLRRLINGHLGYRNFSSFLNGYRIAEAKERLANPESARIPVLTIALDLGYASLGPFNRAFKDATGMTPSDYRRRNIAQSVADSE